MPLMSQEKPILVSFRLSDEEKESLRTLAKSRNENVSDFLRACISGKDVLPGQNDTSLARIGALEAQIKELSRAVQDMFQFFQKNAANLAITEAERARFREILERLKEVQAHGP